MWGVGGKGSGLMVRGLQLRYNSTFRETGLLHIQKVTQGIMKDTMRIP